jgi:hypothetical protein
MADHDPDLSGPDIIDAEIMKDPIRVKSDDSLE